MAAKISTGFRNHLMATSSAHALLSTLVMKLFSGPVPANADAALSGNTLLGVITVDGDGTTPLTWDVTPVAGVLVKDSSDVWEGAYLDDGTLSFFRIETLADAGTLSTTAARAQGSIGLVGADLNFSSLSAVDGAPQVIDNFSFTIPSE